MQYLQLSDVADAVLRSLNDTVITQTVGPARLGSTGMSVYFPPTVELTDVEYEEIAVADSWTEMLLAYYDSGQSIPPDGRPALAGDARSGSGGEVDADAVVEVVEGGVEVSVVVEPSSLANIVDATLSFGYVDPDDGAIVQLGDTQADVSDDGTISGFSDLTALTLTDSDGDSVDAYLSLEFSDDGALSYASVPLDYLAPGASESDPVNLSIVFDSESGEVIQEIYYLIDEDAGSHGELTADPEALISPVVLVFLPDGTIEWESYGDAAVYADLPNLTYGVESLDPGTEIYVDITVTDFGGNELVASATFVLE